MNSVLLLGQVADVAETATLSAGGLAVMCVSVGGVLCLITFCLYRVLTLPPVDRDAGD